ncbi:MAG: restriction endonuclease subunit S [Bacteroidales bacterium]|nr:restriction endonuclease subunit S [Bacteroidales bacterium]
MSKLQPYTAYYPVQYDYVSQLPEGWQLLPNIAIFRERIERGHENEELLSVTIGRGVIKQSELEKKDSSTLDKSKYLLLYPGDLVYSMRFRQGASGYSIYKGIVSPACTVLKPKRGVEINPRFYYYLFRTGFYKNYVERFAYGIADGQIPLRYVDFKRMYSIVPPLETQNAIVAYLDRKTQQIQEFIAKKERLIELLEEQKERLISNAISRGINQNIELKKTDDIWLKEIPKHWEFKPLKRYVKLNQYSITEKTKPNYLLKYVDIGNVTFNGLLNEPEEITFEKAPSRARRIVKSGDTILSTVRTYLKAIAFFDIADDNLIASTGFAVLSPSKNIIPKYLKYLLSSSYFLHKVNFWAIGVNYPSINNDRLMSIKVAVPSRIEEQKVIIEFIEIGLMNFEKTISKAQTEIEKAKEYQESLITQIITGQLKV